MTLADTVWQGAVLSSALVLRRVLERRDALKPPLMFTAMSLALTAPMFARSSGNAAEQPMQAVQYYVGSWTCRGGTIGRLAATAGVTYTLDGSTLRNSVVVNTTPPTRAWMTVETKYDAAKGVYVNTGFDDGGWDVSYAKPWSGNTELWTDHSTANGKLGRDVVVRVDHGTFTHTYYDSLTGTKPAFRYKCTRSR